MALTACGLRIAINGSETDVDVEADNADWLSKVGKVRHQVGGGSWWRDTQPGVANLDMFLPLQLAPKVRTVTLAVSLIPSTVLLPAGTIGAGSANAYRIIFHGDVQSIKGSPTAGGSMIQVDAVSEMSGLLGRKARTAADNNSGISVLLADIETAHSLTMNGSNYFPTVANGFPNCDRPAQKQNTNGVWIRKMLAGTGINMSEEWETSITAPDLRWRPDFQDTDYYTGMTSDRLWETQVAYPWLYAYPDVGVQWKDFVARVVVDGENESGAEHYGYARLATAGDRTAVGNRDVTLSTWIDTGAECEQQARRLLAYQAEPNYLKMNALTFNTEHIYQVMGVDGYGSKNRQVFEAAAGMPGDLFTARDPFGNSHSWARNWPSHAPVSGDVYDTLDALWNPTMTYDTTTATPGRFLARAFTRTFTPTGGWDVTVGLDPLGVDVFNTGLRGSDVSDYGRGTY